MCCPLTFLNCIVFTAGSTFYISKDEELFEDDYASCLFFALDLSFFIATLLIIFFLIACDNNLMIAEIAQVRESTLDTFNH
jgi:hypothetical protein